MYSEKPNYAWYAIYTRPKHEKKVAENLCEKGIECYLPLMKIQRQWSDRKKWVEEPLFRCYAFVRVSYIEFFKVVDTPGVVCYIKFGGKPQTIPDYQIENIRTFVKQEQKEVVITKEKIARGIKAKVLYGPLQGVVGEVVQICGQSKILIRINSMGYCLHAKISKDEIKVLDSCQKQETRKLKKISSYSKPQLA